MKGKIRSYVDWDLSHCPRNHKTSGKNFKNINYNLITNKKTKNFIGAL